MSITSRLFSPTLIICTCARIFFLFAKFSRLTSLSDRFPKSEKIGYNLIDHAGKENGFSTGLKSQTTLHCDISLERAM